MFVAFMVLQICCVMNAPVYFVLRVEAICSLNLNLNQNGLNL
jgi:hypothetical protein